MADPDCDHRIVKLLLESSERAHHHFHHDAKFRAQLLRMSYHCAEMLDVMVTAADVRESGIQEATKRFQQATFPMLFPDTQKEN